jgi:hypothetical protein
MIERHFPTDCRGRCFDAGSSRRAKGIPLRAASVVPRWSPAALVVLPRYLILRETLAENQRLWRWPSGGKLGHHSDPRADEFVCGASEHS